MPTESLSGTDGVGVDRHCNQPEHSRHNEYDRGRGEQSSVSGAWLRRGDGAHLSVDAIDALSTCCSGALSTGDEVGSRTVVPTSGHMQRVDRRGQWTSVVASRVAFSRAIPRRRCVRTVDSSIPSRSPVSTRDQPNATTNNTQIRCDSLKSFKAGTNAGSTSGSMHVRRGSRVDRHGAPCELRSGPLGTGSRRDCPWPRRDPVFPPVCQRLGRRVQPGLRAVGRDQPSAQTRTRLSTNDSKLTTRESPARPRTVTVGAKEPIDALTIHHTSACPTPPSASQADISGWHPKR